MIFWNLKLRLRRKKMYQEQLSFDIFDNNPSTFEAKKKQLINLWEILI